MSDEDADRAFVTGKNDVEYFKSQLRNNVASTLRRRIVTNAVTQSVTYVPGAQYAQLAKVVLLLVALL